MKQWAFLLQWLDVQAHSAEGILGFQTMRRSLSLQALSQERMKAAVFDTSRLVDFGERVQYDGPAALLAPLIREAGRLVLTDRHLYFQALNNVSGDQPVRVHPLALVAAVARRRSSLKPTGLCPQCFNVWTHSTEHPQWWKITADVLLHVQRARSCCCDEMTRELLLRPVLSSVFADLFMAI